MRDLDKNPYSLEDRIKRRLLVEGMPQTEDVDGLADWPLFGPDFDSEENAWVQPILAARIATLEAEDTANPIAATAIARPDLELVLDEASVIAKFTPEVTP